MGRVWGRIRVRVRARVRVRVRAGLNRAHRAEGAERRLDGADRAAVRLVDMQLLELEQALVRIRVGVGLALRARVRVRP